MAAVRPAPIPATRGPIPRSWNLGSGTWDLGHHLGTSDRLCRVRRLHCLSEVAGDPTAQHPGDPAVRDCGALTSGCCRPGRLPGNPRTRGHGDTGTDDRAWMTGSGGAGGGSGGQARQEVSVLAMAWPARPAVNATPDQHPWTDTSCRACTPADLAHGRNALRTSGSDACLDDVYFAHTSSRRAPSGGWASGVVGSAPWFRGANPQFDGWASQIGAAVAAVEGAGWTCGLTDVG